MTSPTEPPEMPDHEPTEPPEPAEPTAPAESTEPAGPTESAEPADTADSSESPEPQEPAEAEPTGESEESADSDDAAASDETAETAKPADTEHVGAKVDTYPVWWEWVGRHRRAVLIVAGVLVVALVATFGGMAIFSPGPKDVVEDYLDALRAGDTDAALEIVGKPNLGNHLDFVSTDAMAEGWTVDAVAVRNQRDSGKSAEADVDVTFGTKDESTQGRFHMVERDDEWRIESPFVPVTINAKGMDTIMIGRVTRKVLQAEPNGGVPVLLFPGVYRVEPGSLMSLSPNEFVAAPQPDRQFEQDYTPTMKLTDEGAEQAHRAVDAYLDECVEQAEVEPVGCPFSADDLVGYWPEVKSIAWQVTAYPRGIFEPSEQGGFTMIARKPGTLRVTGTGIEEDPPAKRFAATCEFGFSEVQYALLTVDVSGDEVAVNSPGADASDAADLATRCH